ncbi:hypothetical protein [Sphingomonas hankookensis]
MEKIKMALDPIAAAIRLHGSMTPWAFPRHLLDAAIAAGQAYLQQRFGM